MSERTQMLILLDATLVFMTVVTWIMGRNADAYIAALVVVGAVYSLAPRTTHDSENEPSRTPKGDGT